MACSTKALKIALQVISGFYMVVAILTVALGIFLLSVVSKSTDSDGLKTFLMVLCWFFIIVGTFMTIISIFGIYYVAKENAGKVKMYGIIHVAMLILNVIVLVFNQMSNVSFICSVVLSCCTVYLSFCLARRFKINAPTLPTIS